MTTLERGWRKLTIRARSRDPELLSGVELLEIQRNLRRAFYAARGEKPPDER